MSHDEKAPFAVIAAKARLEASPHAGKLGVNSYQALEPLTPC